ncbi:cation transporter, partial [Acinetobacter baumannii]|uniref:cation transporter n=1 Tax=Acinetobacter baumannii TaxID=470 RepID=UPI001113D389
MKKVVLKSILEDERSKRRAMKAVAGVGVDSIEVDMKEGKITVIGDADPVWLTTKLRKMG